MTNRNDLAAYTSSLISMGDHAELQERLRLYQVFLKLYEHHRGLLDEILELENSSSAPARTTLPYVQGVISGSQGYLITNLMQGKTQALSQAQQTWTIGRDPRRSLISIQDIRLSRCHAAIRQIEDQGFYLIDLGSRNQSFVNGEPIRETLLKDGDQIRLGSVSFTFFLCHSMRMLEPVPTEVMEQLNQVHSLEAEKNLANFGRTASNSLQHELEEDNIPTLDLYNDTSGFLRPKSID